MNVIWFSDCYSFIIFLYSGTRLGVQYHILYRSIRISVLAQATTRKQRTCNSVSPLHCFAQYTFTSIFYLFNEHVSLMLMFDC